MLGDPTSSHLSSNKGHHFCKKKNEPKPPFGKLSGWWLNQPVLKEYARQHASLPPIFGEKKKQTTKQICIFFPNKKNIFISSPFMNTRFDSICIPSPSWFFYKAKKAFNASGLQGAAFDQKIYFLKLLQKTWKNFPFLHPRDWYIFLHEWLIFNGRCIGKHDIHGAYRYILHNHGSVENDPPSKRKQILEAPVFH